MPTTPLLPLPDGLEITAVSQTADGLLVRVVSNRTSCPCPGCATPSEAVHSFYRRHPLELPCAGQQVQLLLSVHTFFCRVPTCPRKVFTERLPEFLQPNSRLTTRLRMLIQAIGLAFNGQGGARLGKQFGIQISRVTLLRSLHLIAPPPVGQVRVVGIDDLPGNVENATAPSFSISKVMRCLICCLTEKLTVSKTGWQLIPKSRS